MFEGEKFLRRDEIFEKKLATLEPHLVDEEAKADNSLREVLSPEEQRLVTERIQTQYLWEILQNRGE